MPNRQDRRRLKKLGLPPDTPAPPISLPQQTQPLWWRGLFSTWKRIAGWAVAFVAFAASVFPFLPSLDASPSFQQDQTRPYSEVFVITNTGWITLYNLHFDCVQDWFKDANENSGKMNKELNAIATVPRLSSGGKTSIQCRYAVKSGYELVEANISIIIHYQTLLPIYTAEKPFRFLGVKTKDGQMRWTPQTS
jgi:hypothetical protein